MFCLDLEILEYTPSHVGWVESGNETSEYHDIECFVLTLKCENTLLLLMHVGWVESGNETSEYHDIECFVLTLKCENTLLLLT